MPHRKNVPQTHMLRYLVCPDQTGHETKLWGSPVTLTGRKGGEIVHHLFCPEKGCGGVGRPLGSRPMIAYRGPAPLHNQIVRFNFEDGEWEMVDVDGPRRRKERVG
jgi:hypothetical protein